MTEEAQQQPDNPQTIASLQQELLKLEAALQAIKAQQVAKEQVAVDELEREREAYRQEQITMAKRQAALIRRGQADPWFWADGGWMSLD